MTCPSFYVVKLSSPALYLVPLDSIIRFMTLHRNMEVKVWLVTPNNAPADVTEGLVNEVFSQWNKPPEEEGVSRAEHENQERFGWEQV